MKNKPNVIVIPTTHWDRAWYWPFERFRIKLIDMWEAVKYMWEKYPDYTFNSDGQALCVEDYLEIFPEDRELFRKMGREGRLSIGSLYCQSDVYCTGGEALIRNILAGRELAEDLCALQKIIYMPDTFGHTPSIPMICQGFGIDTYTFMRGVPDGVDANVRFWLWESPDGSRVQVFRMRDGYANGARLGLYRGTGEIMDKESSGIKPGFKMDMAVAQITEAAEKQIDNMGAPYVLNAGVDHQIPQKELTDIMEAARTEELDFKYSTWTEVMETMRKKDQSEWTVYRGENHGKGAATILGGTVSSRIYLKQKNAYCERMLTNCAEPADALATLIGNPASAGKVISHIWRRLLKCHPHDNITGCSVDTVHREDEANFAAVEQAADAVTRKMAEQILEVYGGQDIEDQRYAFFLYNFQTKPITKNVLVKMDHEGRSDWGDMPVHDCYDIVDEKGNAVPFREVSRERSIEHPHPVVYIEIQAELPAFNIKRYFFEKRQSWPKTELGNILENEFLKVTINDNSSLDMLNKQTGQNWPGLCLLSDQADLGDEYDFSHIENDTELLCDDLNFSRTDKFGCNGMQFAEFCGNLRIPQNSNFEGRSKELTELPVTLCYTLAPDADVLNVKIKFKNTASDHRLRLNMCLETRTETSRAGLKFNEVVRPFDRRFMLKKDETEYAIDPIHPADHYVAVNNSDTGEGIAIFAEFPFNYEVTDVVKVRLAITLLRSVGILSHGHLTRGPGAGPDTLTPEAQCLNRDFEMNFGIKPFSKTNEKKLFHDAMLWRYQPLFGLIMGYTPFIKKQVPENIITIDNPAILVSAFKQSFSNDGKIILRLFNTSEVEQEFSIDSQGMKDFRPVLLDEKSSDDRLENTIPPFGLKSFLIVPS